MVSKTTEIIFAVILLVVFGIFLVFIISGFGGEGDGTSDVKELTVTPIELPSSLSISPSGSSGANVFCPFSTGDDLDDDGIVDICDNCPGYYNPEQGDNDNDGYGNECDFQDDHQDNGPEDECDSDYDCGDDGFISEVYCSSEENVVRLYESFTCNDPDEEDSECDSETEEILIEDCEFYCVFGECREFACEVDDDCDDSDPWTFDQCINPGTLEAVCENNLMECLSDDDCGVDGFIGEPYCSLEDDVVQLFESFTCNEPGTLLSSCSSETTEEFVEDCEDVCDEGECFDVECDGDGDCDDGGFVGGLFCMFDDIFQNFEEGMCTDSGLITSGCGFDIVSHFVDSCPYACDGGECVRCDEDQDCDDSDSLTEDFCMLPDTVLSYCSYDFIGDCTPGDTQQCGANNIGECSFGIETCDAFGEWEDCSGAVWPVSEICNGLDDDCDGETDEGDVCGLPECDDGIDNDGDGFIDYPNDAGCTDPFDDSEDPFNFHECNDGIDNDGDGYTDYPEDYGCYNVFDDSEDPFNYPHCDDGFDNDGDGLIDFPSDPDCINLLDNDETQ